MRKIILIFGAIQLVSQISAHVVQAKVSDCSKSVSGRVSIQKREVRSQGLDGWALETVQQAGVVSCRASGKFQTREFLFIYDPVHKYRGGQLFFEVVSRDHQLPAGYEGPARLFIDQKQGPTGQLRDVGDWTGAKRTASYVRAEFIGLEKFTASSIAGKTLQIQSEKAQMKPIDVPPLGHVIKALQDCHAKATDSGSRSFWGKGEAGCG